ncbi:MAG TPA: helix-turn-helix transcriptional regulator [Ktedonobacterales bacterium]|nr:helix-turn-helix transcriptional regulator [Ktedonobacterales bacterium]
MGWQQFALRELAQAIQYAAPPPPRAPHDDLTPRAVKVLRLVAQGMTNAQVAALVITPRAVNAHLTAIYGTRPR